MSEQKEEARKAFEQVKAAADAARSNEQADQRPAMPIDWSTEPTPAAANGVQVLHAPRQFAVVFTDHAPFPGRNAIDHKAGNERARVVASLRMDPDTYFQALSVMASNWNRFVEAHVPPQMRQPRFKLIDAGDMQLHGFKPEE
ncbi:MAG TPA: hypothetical protein DEF51_23995 [Myxococcales bacterium]|nr:hypothetical protein [Myxococcales bacterium]